MIRHYKGARPMIRHYKDGDRVIYITKNGGVTHGARGTVISSEPTHGLTRVRFDDPDNVPRSVNAYWWCCNSSLVPALRYDNDIRRIENGDK